MSDERKHDDMESWTGPDDLPVINMVNLWIYREKTVWVNIWMPLKGGFKCFIMQ
jgi:hypothetical protein